MQVADLVAAVERASSGWPKNLCEETAHEMGMLIKPEERSPVIPIVIVQTSPCVTADEIKRRLCRSCACWCIRVEKVSRTTGDTKDVLRIGDLNRQAVRNRRHALVVPTQTKI